jgi:hypothetical protein
VRLQVITIDILSLTGNSSFINQHYCVPELLAFRGLKSQREKIRGLPITQHYFIPESLVFRGPFGQHFIRIHFQVSTPLYCFRSPWTIPNSRKLELDMSNEMTMVVVPTHGSSQHYVVPELLVVRGLKSQHEKTHPQGFSQHYCVPEWLAFRGPVSQHEEL